MNSSSVYLALLAAGALLAGATQAGAAPLLLYRPSRNGSQSFARGINSVRAGRGIFPSAWRKWLRLPRYRLERHDGDRPWHAGRKLQPLLWHQQFGTGCRRPKLYYRTQRATVWNGITGTGLSSLRGIIARPKPSMMLAMRLDLSFPRLRPIMPRYGTARL